MDIKAIIGDVLARHITDLFEDNDEKQIVRVCNFSLDEVAPAIDSLRSLSEMPDGPELRILVGVGNEIDSSEIGLIPKECILPTGQPATFIRNLQDTHNYVLFELEEQSDRQSFAQVFTVNDSTILYGATEGSGIGRMLEAAWRLQFGERKLSKLLSARVLDYMESYRKTVLTPPLRTAAAFMGAVVSRKDVVGDITDNEAWNAILAAQTILGLFRDIEASSLPNNAILARMKGNYSAAELIGPGGTDLNRQDIEEKAAKVIFKDPLTEKKMDEERQTHFRNLSMEYCRDKDPSLLSDIPWGVFSQIFKTGSRKLGDKVRDDIEANDPSRLVELDDLDFVGGLNAGNPDTARDFLAAVSSYPDKCSLESLLRKGTNNSVVRLANKAQKVTQFLPWLIREIHGAVVGVEERKCFRLSIESPERPSDVPWHTLHVFNFLYSKTLQLVAEESLDLANLFVVDDSRLLFEPECFTEDIQASEDLSQDAQVDYWEPLLFRFEIRNISENGTETPFDISTILWDPVALDVLSFLALKSVDARLRGATRFEVSSSIEPREWFERVAQGGIEASSYLKSNENTGALGNWQSIRANFLSGLANEGISASECQIYFDKWALEIIPEARDEFVLDGSSQAKFCDFMMMDTVKFLDSIVMLASHPLRIRWIAKYLEHLQVYLQKALDGGLAIVTRNEGFLFDTLESLSPHRKPPYFVDDKGGVYLPSEEFGWVEEFRSIEEGLSGNRHWSNFLDDGCIEALSSECLRFVEFHPHKKSGVDILIVLLSYSDLVGRISKRLLSKRGRDNDFTVRYHIVAPKEVLASGTILDEELISNFEEGDGSRVHPRVQVNIYPWEPGTGVIDIVGKDNVDIAIVPNLFSQDLKAIPFACEADIYSEAYSPLFTHPVRSSASGGESVNLQLDLLPRNDDQCLLDWAALSVMLNRSAPLDPSNPLDPAFLRLRIMVENAKNLYSDLHEAALWVLTLDTYVSRQHVENLPGKPEVITFKERIGKNGMYNLVVSSKAGKQFIVPRLARKIGELVPGEPNTDRDFRIAGELYGESCNLAPGIVLRSLGGGWTLNELMGLVATKRLLRELNKNDHEPEAISDIWIPLDEHPYWFGGASNSKRADLLRLLIREAEDGALAIRFSVIESKLGGSSLVGNAVEQVAATVELVTEAFCAGKNKMSDGRLWRESLLAAIENTLVRGNEYDQKIPEGMLERIRAAISVGDYSVDAVEGIAACHSLIDCPDQKKEFKGVTVYQIGHETLVKLLFEDQMSNSCLLLDEGNTNVKMDFPGKEPNKATGTSVSQVGSDLISTPISLNNKKSDLNGEVMVFEDYDLVERQAIYQDVVDRLGLLDVKLRAIPDGVDKFIEGPAFFRLRLEMDPKTTVSKVRQRSDDIHTCLKMQENERLRIFSDSGYVWIEAPKAENRRSPVTYENIWSGYGASMEDRLNFRVPLGIDQTGSVVTVDFGSSQSPHLLVAGTTGAGKSVALNTILFGAMDLLGEEDLEMYLIDPKGVELIDFEDYCQVKSVQFDPQDSIELLEGAVEEMQGRYTKFREIRKTAGRAAKNIVEYNQMAEKKIPRWLVVLDEYSDLVSDPSDKKIIEGLLKRLCQKARAAGMHVIVATQKPLADVVGTVVKSNLPASLALKVANSTDSRTILDVPGAEALAGKGDALFKAGDGKIIRLQCAFRS